MALKSSIRGYDLFPDTAFVHDLGIRDLEFGSEFVAELAWRLGSQAGIYRGRIIASKDPDLAEFLATFTSRTGLTYNRWRHDGLHFPFPDFRLIDDVYVFRTPSRWAHVYVPRFPDLDLAMCASREETFWSVFDPEGKVLSDIELLAKHYCLKLGPSMSGTLEAIALQTTRDFLQYISTKQISDW